MAGPVNSRNPYFFIPTEIEFEEKNDDSEPIAEQVEPDIAVEDFSQVAPDISDEDSPPPRQAIHSFALAAAFHADDQANRHLCEYDPDGIPFDTIDVPFRSLICDELEKGKYQMLRPPRYRGSDAPYVLQAEDVDHLDRLVKVFTLKAWLAHVRRGERITEFSLQDIRECQVGRFFLDTLSSKVEGSQEEVPLEKSLLVATGIEKGKGGLSALMDIMLTGYVLTRWRGQLDSDYGHSAFAHGPYYVLYGKSWDSDHYPDTQVPKWPRHSSDHCAYIVPSERDRNHLVLAMQFAVQDEVEMIPKNLADSLCKRVITTAEYNLILKELLEAGAEITNENFAEKMKAKITHR